jgi:uncharacterized protein
MYFRLLATASLAWIGLATTVVAAPAMKALIIDGQNNHNWKGVTPELKKALEETGLFTVDVATTPPNTRSEENRAAMAKFHPKFSDYNIVVMNYNGDNWPAETQKDFESFVSGGGGLVIVHAADNSFRNWKEFNKMIGIGGWGGRNETDGPYVYWQDGKIVRDTSRGPGGTHGAQIPFAVEVRVADHPITKGLPEKFMHDKDELYSRMRGPAENMTVLATSMSNSTRREEPILMTIDYGKGRVFHTMMGHDVPQCRCVAFIVTLQRGAEWAATGKVTQAVPADFPTADKVSVRK